MIIRKVICDRCGKELTDSERYDLNLQQPLWLSIDKQYELCEDCVTKVLKFINPKLVGDINV